METNTEKIETKKEYESPRVLASYDKEELDDAIGINDEVEGAGGGCGCGGGSIL